MPKIKTSKDVVNKMDIQETIYNKHRDLDKYTANAIVQEVFDEIKNGVDEGKAVSIGGFGIFISKQMKPRVGRNPRTGKSVIIPTHLKIKFKPSEAFKELIKIK